MWLILAEVAELSTLERWLDKYGLPLVMLVVMCWLFYKAGVMAFEYFKKKDDQAHQTNESYRQDLKDVHTKLETYQETTAKQCATAIQGVQTVGQQMLASDVETKETLANVNETLHQIRREILGSSSSRKVVGD